MEKGRKGKKKWEGKAEGEGNGKLEIGGGCLIGFVGDRRPHGVRLFTPQVSPAIRLKILVHESDHRQCRVYKLRRLKYFTSDNEWRVS